MLTILLSWLYITGVSFLIGTFFIQLVTKIFVVEKPVIHFTIIALSGLILLSILVSIFSLFYKVALLANIFALALAILSYAVNKKNIHDAIKQYLGEIQKSSK